MSKSEKKLIQTYLKRAHHKSDEDFWAWEEIDDIVHENSEEGWKIIIKLLDASENEKEAGWIGAGPLEDWVNLFGADLTEKIENEVKANTKFAYALSVVDIYDEGSNLEKFLEYLVENYKLDSVKLG